MKFQLNAILGVVLTFALTMSSLCVAVVMQGPGGPQLMCVLDDGCEAIVDPNSGELCCPCADSSDPNACTGGGVPEPPNPPTTDPPNPPRPCVDPGTGPDTGDPCYPEDTGITAGKMVECTSPELRQALAIPPVTDWVAMGKGSGDCVDGCGGEECPEDSGSS